MTGVVDRMDALVSAARSHGLPCTLNGPALAIYINQARLKYGVSSNEYCEILSKFNGARIGQLNFLSYQMMYFYYFGFSIHSWADQCVDCVSNGKRYPLGSVYFCNRSPSDTYLIAESVSIWLKELTEEMSTYGSVWHPRDYLNNQSSERHGVYKKIATSLKEVDKHVADYVNRRFWGR